MDYSDEDALIENLIQTADSLVRDAARKDTEDGASAPVMHIAEMYAIAYLYEHREEADHNSLLLTLRAILFGVREAKF